MSCFRILIRSAIDLGRFISCGIRSPLKVCISWTGDTALRCSRRTFDKNVNKTTFHHSYFCLKFSYLTQNFQTQELIVQIEILPQKRLNKALRVNNRFCEGKKGFA